MIKKVIIHEFDPVIYPVKLWVIKNPTIELIHEQFEEIDGKKLNLTLIGNSAAVTYGKVIAA